MWIGAQIKLYKNYTYVRPRRSCHFGRATRSKLSIYMLIIWNEKSYVYNFDVCGVAVHRHAQYTLAYLREICASARCKSVCVSLRMMIVHTYYGRCSKTNWQKRFYFHFFHFIVFAVLCLRLLVLSSPCADADADVVNGARVSSNRDRKLSHSNDTHTRSHVSISTNTISMCGYIFADRDASQCTLFSAKSNSLWKYAMVDARLMRSCSGDTLFCFGYFS